jgi:hypothetical protein
VSGTYRGSADPPGSRIFPVLKIGLRFDLGSDQMARD